MSRAVYVTSMQNRDTQTTHTHTRIYTKKKKKTDKLPTTICFLYNRPAHLTYFGYRHLIHTGHILSSMFYTKSHHLSPEPGLYPLWVLELGIK